MQGDTSPVWRTIISPGQLAALTAIYTAAKGLWVKPDITKVKNTNNALQDETKRVTRVKLVKLQLN